MLTLSFTFPAGRYHGTPWGRHVNEADVAWPPDPWRLCRALIATWHRKLDPARHGPETLSALLAALAREAPHYHLPEAVHFHTRHYMPLGTIEKHREKTTQIFDAFAQIGREAALIMHWPSLQLPPAELALLDDALAVLGYLGRAESWVEATRINDWSGACACRPDDDGENADAEAATQAAVDLVPLWLPLSPEQYDQERARQIAAAEARIAAERLAKEADAPPSGKAPSKAAKPKPIKLPADLAATLPESWLAALSLDSGELQKAGWNAPPAARRLLYRRPKDALRFMAARVAPSAQSAAAAPVTTARFALYAKPRPMLTEAVRVGETLRIAAMGRARRLFDGQLPPLLSGHDLPDDNRHAHAFFLPEDADGDGRVDHLILHAPGGLDGAMQSVLAQLSQVKTRDEREWRLLLEGLGSPAQFPDSALLHQAVIWESSTPYLHPWFQKKRFGLVEQVTKECQLRGLPGLRSVAILPDSGQTRVLDFRRWRNKRGLAQPDRHGCRLRLEFDQPVTGPLALGFACHFGLGLFQPVT